MFCTGIVVTFLIVLFLPHQMKFWQGEMLLGIRRSRLWLLAELIPQYRSVRLFVVTGLTAEDLLPS